jgi:cobaltochelatase CobS
VWKVIERRFKEATRFWLAKSGNFDKHVDFLKSKILGRFSDSYDSAELAEALDTFKSDPDAGTDRIFETLKMALERKFQFEMGKGQRILNAHEDGSAEMQDMGNGQIAVPSENDSGKTYTVDLTKLQCECRSAKTLSYAGFLCKHTMAAVEAFKHRYPIALEAEGKPARDFRIEKSEDVKADSDSDEYFIYGSQKLKKRKLTGNPLIPSGIYHVLEGGEPEMVIHALAETESLMLIGDSGTGKSKLIQYLAQETNTPLMAPCGHAEVTVESLLGCMTAINGSTVWQDGVLPECMRKGYWLMIEEINAIDPGVAKILNELLDNRSITITIAGRPRTVKAAEGFRLICATNPPDNPIYKGIESMSFELMDRFDAVVWLDYLSSGKEVEVVAERSGYDDMEKIRKMVEFANGVRVGMQKGEVFGTVTTRGLISWAKKAKVFGVRAAAEAAILRKMDTVSRTKALDLFEAYFRDSDG